MQGGLSGSTAILSSLVAGLLRMWGREFSRYYLAETVRIIELNYLKIHCGYQDHYMTVFGGINFMDFREKENYRRLGEEIYATVEPLAPHVKELPFLLAHSGIKHVSGAVHLPIRERWLDGEKLVVEGYERIAGLCRRGKRALIERDWQTLADLMNENHRIQHEISHVGERNLAHDGRRARKRRACRQARRRRRRRDHHRPHPRPRASDAALKEAGAARFLTLKPLAGRNCRNRRGLV